MRRVFSWENTLQMSIIKLPHQVMGNENQAVKDYPTIASNSGLETLSKLRYL